MLWHYRHLTLYHDNSISPSLSLLLLRQVMFTLLTTRNSRESNAMVRTTTLIYVTLQNHFVFFTSKAQGTWYLLPFNFSKNLPTLTQYGPLTIHIVIGCSQKCGFAMLTIKYIRSVIEKWEDIWVTCESYWSKHFRKLSLNVWFIILKCVIKRVWLFHLYILWPNSFPNEEKKKQGKQGRYNFASMAIYCHTLNREIIETSKSFLMQMLLYPHK